MQKKPFWSGPKRPLSSGNQNSAGRRKNNRRPGGKKDQEAGYAINEEIRSPEVRLVGDNVEEGIYPVQRAQRLANELELDLIEIVPQAQPPVCRIMDYQKFLYQQRKRLKEQKAKSTKVVVKEIRFGPQTDDHDYNFKLKHAIEFLKEGSKVKSYVFFKGRSILFKEQGEVLLLRFANDLEEYARVDQMPLLEGKRMTIMLSPKKPGQGKKKDEAAKPEAQGETPAEPAAPDTTQPQAEE
ncbi:MAG: translation initiation factor IF-3 [Muribaculaceae bacterium]|nr:translation initiation factor IF-3 [Muribaculaceae bacterium]